MGGSREWDAGGYMFMRHRVRACRTAYYSEVRHELPLTASVCAAAGRSKRCIKQHWCGNSGQDSLAGRRKASCPHLDRKARNSASDAPTPVKSWWPPSCPCTAHIFAE